MRIAAAAFGIPSSGPMPLADNRTTATKIETKTSSRILISLAAMVVFPLFIPGHLDGLEFRFVRQLGIVLKVGQPGHQLVQVCKAKRKRIGLRMKIRQLDGDVFR